MDNRFAAMQGMTVRQFLLDILRGLLPSLLVNIVGMLIVYNLLGAFFPAPSLIPLLGASLFPLLGNIVTFLKHHRFDVIGMMILFGLVISIIAILLGGSSQVLLIRESFTTGAIGLLLLVSLIFPKPLGYYFARQFLAGNDSTTGEYFESLWQVPFFRKSLTGGTVFWAALLLVEFGLRVVMVLTLPVVAVLTLSPIVFNGIIVAGIITSALWARHITRCLGEMRQDQTTQLKEVNEQGRWLPSQQRQREKDATSYK